MKRCLFVAATAAAWTLTAFAQNRAPQNESIRQDALRADLFFLAGDAMRGRLTDTNENRATADYIRSRFERAGLTPAARNHSYFQDYNLMTATIDGSPQANAVDLLPSEGNSRHLRLGQDFYPHRYSASGEAVGQVAFVGFGIAAPHLHYDDYNGDGVVTSEPSTVWRKALAAQERGAVAVLFTSDVHNHPAPANFEATARNYWPETPPRIKSYTLATWADRVHIPVAQISPAIAASLVSGTGRAFEDLAKSAETTRGFTPLLLPNARVSVHVSVDRHLVPDHNVVGLLEGGDPRLKNEWVIVSAHFDHDGVNGTQILNGADDNGSGTVALLSIADAYALAARDGHRPKRSVLFAAWNSEERGLLGAWAFTEQPLAPLSSIAAVLNMDMIGRNEEVQVGGGPRFNGLEVQTAESNANAVNVMGFSRAPDVAAAVDRSNAAIGLELKKRYDNNSSNLLRRSDQWPFLQRGVPALGFMTGLHPDYHTQYDRPEKINYVKMEKIARLIYQASWDLANADSRPKGSTSASLAER